MPKISDFLLLERPEQPVLEIAFEASLPEIADKITQSFEKLYSYLTSLGALTSDVPYVVYCNWREMYEKPIKMCVGLPVSAVYPAQGEIKTHIAPASKYVMCMFRGAFDEMHDFYDRMEKWCVDNNLEVTGDCIEMYYNGAELDESEYLTKVVFTLK